MAEDAHAPARPVVRRDYVPAADYTAGFHRLEMERMWPKTWQAACRLEEIPHAGDYVNYEIGTESILVVRTASGGINAFYNVCPHRGRRLRDDERGSLKAIYCGYHAWTFDLDGNCTDIPEAEDWAGCPAATKADFSLTRVQCDTWAGWVWINMDPQAPSLMEYLAPLPERLDAFEWENCRIRSHQTLILPVNWKVALEAFVEPYHVVATHPQLLKWGHGRAHGTEEYLVPGHRHAGHDGTRNYQFSEDDHFQDPREYMATTIANTYHTLHGLYHEDGLRAAERLMDEIPEGASLAEVSNRYWEMRREEMLKSGAPYPEKLTRDHVRNIEWLMFPNSSVLTSVEGAFWYRSRPNGDDPNSCIFQVIVLGRYAPGKEPKFEYERYDNLADFKGRNPILEQDFSNLLAVQKGLKSRGFKAARPNPLQETQVGNFHRVLHGYIHGTDDWGEP